MGKDVKCAACLATISAKYHDCVVCAGCSANFHQHCSSLTLSEWSSMRDDDSINSWKCSTCMFRADSSDSVNDSAYLDVTAGAITDEVLDSIGRNPKPRSVDPKPKSAASNPEKVVQDPTLADILTEIRKISTKNDNLETSINYLHAQLAEANQLLRDQERKFKECQTQIDNLSVANATLKAENSKLTLRVNDLEQYSRRNCVEVKNIPEVAGENVQSTIAALGQAVGFPIDVSMIDAAHRLRKNPNAPSEPRAIIIKFVRRTDKDRLLQLRRAKRTLNTHDLKESVPVVTKFVARPIFINESLTRSNRVLLAKCKQFRRERGIKYLWVRNGTIYMRKEEGSKAVEISSEASFPDVL